MRHSVLGGGDRFIPLRPEFGRICDGNACAALLLAVFDWRAAQLDNRLTDDPWFRATLTWLEDWLGGCYGRSAIRSALTLLEEKGYIERKQDPARKLDRGTHFRLNGPCVEIALCKVRSPTVDDAISHSHAGASDVGEELQAVEEGASGPTDVELLWLHVAEVCPPAHAELTTSRRRVLERALKEAPLDLCRRAVDGLKEYVAKTGKGKPDIARVFVTRPGGSALADQIEWWADQATGVSSSSSFAAQMPRHMSDALRSAHRRKSDDIEVEGALAHQVAQAEAWLERRGWTYKFEGARLIVEKKS